MAMGALPGMWPEHAVHYSVEGQQPSNYSTEPSSSDDAIDMGNAYLGCCHTWSAHHVAVCPAQVPLVVDSQHQHGPALLLQHLY